MQKRYQRTVMEHPGCGWVFKDLDAILLARRKQVIRGQRKPRIGNATREQLIDEAALILAKLELLGKESNDCDRREAQEENTTDVLAPIG